MNTELATQILTMWHTTHDREKTSRRSARMVVTAAVRAEGRWVCKYCKSRDGKRKMSYESEARAWRAIGEMLRTDDAKQRIREIPNRAYPCPRGEGYHVTSA